MKKYYVHNGIESSGPFDLAELQMKQITATTPVWFSGMPDWKTASEIDELQTILKIAPPPFKSVPPKQKKEEENPKIMGLKKKTFYVVFLFVLLIIGSIVLTILEENRKIELEQKNLKTEKENQQFQLQEKEIQEQKQRISEQEKLETERLTKERKAAINSKLSENQIKQIEYQSRLEEAKNNLIKANEFQFFRTSEEKNSEINAIQTDITDFNNEIKLLENERNQLDLELEKIQLKENQNP